MPWLDGDDLRSFVLDDAAVGIFDMDLAADEKPDVRMQALPTIFLPVLKSIAFPTPPELSIAVRLTSSGTTGKPSVTPLDEPSMRIVGYVKQVGSVVADVPDPTAITLEQVEANDVRCPDPAKATEMIALIDWVAAEFQKENGIDLRKDPMALQRLKEAWPWRDPP